MIRMSPEITAGAPGHPADVTLGVGHARRRRGKSPVVGETGGVTAAIFRRTDGCGGGRGADAALDQVSGSDPEASSRATVTPSPT
jgi:hypothetical protein